MLNKVQMTNIEIVTDCRSIRLTRNTCRPLGLVSSVTLSRSIRSKADSNGDWKRNWSLCRRKITQSRAELHRSAILMLSQNDIDVMCYLSVNKLFNKVKWYLTRKISVLKMFTFDWDYRILIFLTILVTKTLTNLLIYST